MTASTVSGAGNCPHMSTQRRKQITSWYYYENSFALVHTLMGSQGPQGDHRPRFEDYSFRAMGAVHHWEHFE